MKSDCLIGVYYDYDDTRLVTFDDLKMQVKADQTYKAESKYSLKDYLDRRKITNLRRFLYCPNCGEKIDWKYIKEQSNTE